MPLSRLALAALVTATAASVLTGIDVASAAPSSCPDTYLRVVDVSTVVQLQVALGQAQPGDQIRLADGIYPGRFTMNVPGTSSAPVVLCGSSAAVIDGGTTSSGYALYVQNAPYTSVYGITITDAQKGIVLDGSSHAVIDGVTVHGIGDEGVHFRRATSDSVIRNSWVYDTGRETPQYGEGVYVGSAHSNWCDYTSCGPDRSDRDQVLNNRVGPGVTAESVDVKEGTSGGTVKGNSFDGSAMVDMTGGASSWVDVKGNSWLITENTGRYTLRHGLTDSLAVSGWGSYNTFTANTLYVNAAGYGVRVASGVTGVRVGTSNVVYEARAGDSNVPMVDA